MGVYIKGIDMPKEGYCDIVSIHSNGDVCRWFAKQNNVPIAEAIEVKEPLMRMRCSKLALLIGEDGKCLDYDKEKS